MTRSLGSLTLLALLAACGDKDEKTNPIDNDGDGYTEDEDCDDADPQAYPGASEICDGADNNCDGIVDEGLSLEWYADADDDGYGDPDATTQACTRPSGHVDNDEDCDDTDEEINPDAEETCDEVDNDCDGSIDEGVTITLYADDDGDGYGDARSTSEACEATAGLVTDDNDCDDANLDTYPGAEELCDGEDNDCNNVIDDGATDLFYADEDGDGYGNPDDSVTACEAPDGYVDDASDCDDDDMKINPSRSEECDDVDNDCDGDIDEDDAKDALDWYADDDEDGFGDPDASTTACEAPAGYTDDDSDCDDSDAAVNPHADEYCDAVDNDCDGTTDEDDAVDASPWYYDADGDTFGDPATSTAACSKPAGYTSNDEDCDDTNKNIHPGVDEKCDGSDNDCDGDTDEGDAIDAHTYYVDNDGDGYGDASTSTTACSRPSGYSLYDTDCDDTKGAVSPVAVEVCDEIDNDCDGTVDGSSATDATDWYLDADSDGYGTPSTSLTECDQPTGYVDNDEDCDDSDAAVNGAAVEYCEDGLDNDCSDGDSTCPTAGELVITEFLPAPSALTDGFGEWVELYNASDDTFDLEGLAVLDADGLGFVVDEKVEIGPGEYVVLVRSTSATSTYDYVYGVGYTLDNFQDEIVVATYGTDGTDGNVIDEIAYDFGFGGDWDKTTGYAVSLDPGYLDADLNDDYTYWCDATSTFSTGDYGTPGAENDSCGYASASGLSPSEGLDAGGLEVLITGMGLTATTDVTFGGESASFTIDSDTQITATTPAAGGAGWVDVSITDGTRTSTLEDAFLYTGTDTDVGRCNLQYPQTTTMAAGVDSETIYGRVYLAGTTNAAGQGAGITGQVGFGDDGSDPSTDPSWTWFDADYNTDYSNNDEYMGTFSVDAAGTYAYAYRFSHDDGINYLYCDYDSGSQPSDPYEVADQGTVTVTP